MGRMKAGWLVLLAFPAWGAERGLTWEQAVNEARLNHPTLRRASLSVTSARVERRAADGGYYPQLSASSSWSNNLSGNPSSFSYGASGRFTVFDGFSREGRVDRAEASLGKTGVAYFSAEAEVRAALRSAFVEVLYAQSLIPLNEKIAARRREVAGIIRLQYEAGKEDKGSWLRTEALADQSGFDVESARRNLETAKWALARELGRSAPVAEGASGELVPPALPPVRLDHAGELAALAKGTPAYRQAAADEELARAGVRVAEAVWYPDVSMSGGWTQSGTNLFQTSSGWNIGLSASFPFFNGGENHAQVEQALIQLSQSAATTARTEAELIASLADAFAALADAVNEVGIRRRLMEAAEVRAQIAKAQYANGLLTYQNWDLIESETIQAQRAWLAGRRAALAAQTHWERTLGRGLSE